MNIARKDSVLVACSSQLPAASARRSNGVVAAAAYPPPLHLNHHYANANNNCNAHNGIGVSPVTGRAHNTAAKTSVILNGTGRQEQQSADYLEPEIHMETEEEEEEDDNSSLETTTPEPVSPSSVQGSQFKSAGATARVETGITPHHHLGTMQDLQAGTQYPLSGDLPSMDPGLPSPSLGFELPQHEGVSSPPSSPNSPASASYGSSRPHPLPSHFTSSPSPPILTTTSPTPSQAQLAPFTLPSTHICTTLTTTPPPPPFLLSCSSHTSSSSISGPSTCRHQEGDVQEMEGLGSYTCLWDDCNMDFPNLSYLVAHLDRGHTATMVTYRCLWRDCQRDRKPFDARYKLITHLRCHTGEKPYKCDVKGCIRSFSRLENLKLHVRTHTGEKPYACHYENCNKRFNNTSDRAKHMKTHITRKPYACKIPGCTKSYTDPSSMRKHVKFAHRIREGSSDSSSSSSTGGSIPWHKRSPRKPSSPSHLVSPSLLGPNSPELLLHYSVPPLTKITSTANRMSVIRQESITAVTSVLPQPQFSYVVAQPSPTVSTTLTNPLLQTSPSSVVSAPAQPLLPLPVFQVPAATTGAGLSGGSVATAAPPSGFQPVIMQIEGTDQKVMVFVPCSAVSPLSLGPVKPGEGSRESKRYPDSPSRQQHVLSFQSRPSVLVSPSQNRTPPAASVPPLLPTSLVPAATPTQTLDSASVEYQVRMQVAHLQHQLQSTYTPGTASTTTQPSSLPNYPLIQLPRTPLVTRMTTPSPLKAELAVPSMSEEPIPITLHAMPQTTVSSAETSPILFPRQGIVLQPQVLQNPQVAQYMQTASFVQLPQLSNLTPVNVAHTLAQPSSSSSSFHYASASSSQGSKSSVSIKPLTVVQPSQCVGFGGPATVVLRPGQVFSVMPSPSHVFLPPGTLSNISRS